METPRDAPFKEKLRIEIAKLREMTLKNKIEYLWEYYKIFIIGTIILLILIGSLINTRFINPPPETALFISWNTGFITEEHLTEEQMEDLRIALEKRLIDEKVNKEIVISQVIASDVNPNFAMANTQRTVTMVAAGTIDAFFLDEGMFEEKIISRFLLPMESLLAEIQSKNPTAYDRINENITYKLYEPEEGNASERIMGIYIGSSPLFTELGFSKQELYFSVSITTENTDNIINALIALFE